MVGTAAEVHNDARDDETDDQGDCGVSTGACTVAASLLLIMAKMN